MYKIRHRTSGFTLLELLVVIAIIGIVTTITLSSLANSRAKGRDATRLSDMRQLRNAIELYRINNNLVPTGAGCCGALDSGTVLQALVTSNLMPRIPTDPNRTGTEGYFYRNNTTWSAEVANDSNNNTYAIRFYMERGTSLGGGGQYYCLTSQGIESSGGSACTQR